MMDQMGTKPGLEDIFVEIVVDRSLARDNRVDDALVELCKRRNRPRRSLASRWLSRRWPGRPGPGGGSRLFSSGRFWRLGAARQGNQDHQNPIPHGEKFPLTVRGPISRIAPGQPWTEEWRWRTFRETPSLCANPADFQLEVLAGQSPRRKYCDTLTFTNSEVPARGVRL